MPDHLATSSTESPRANRWKNELLPPRRTRGVRNYHGAQSHPVPGASGRPLARILIDDILESNAPIMRPSEGRFVNAVWSPIFPINSKPVS